MILAAAIQRANDKLAETHAGLGEHVFRLVLPLDLAPTLNVYAGLKGWKRGKLRTAVDEVIAQQKRPYSGWAMGVRRVATIGKKAKRVKGRTVLTVHIGSKVVGGGRKRVVVVTRESSRRPDEIACDVIGSKIALDRLVQADVLRGDSARWVERRARWIQARPGEGRLMVDVFECAP